jgi:carboxypeptidase family protein/flagellar hook capping protein FlgD
MTPHRSTLSILLLASWLLIPSATPSLATTFTLETVDNAIEPPVDPLFIVLDFPSIAVDQAGDPHVAYSDPTTSTLRHAFRTGGVWTIEVVAPSGPDLIDGVVIAFPSIAIDASGNPHISYYDAPTGTLCYASKTAGVWTSETVDNGYDVGRGTSLAIDSAGNPHIAYYDEGNFDLKYAIKSGGVWQVETVDSDNIVGQQAAIAVDALGHPHISYMDYTDGALQYATKSAGVWSFETLYLTGGSAISIPSDIAIDSSGRPHVSYGRVIGADLYYTFESGGVWTTEAVDVPTSVGLDNSIALTAAGQPRISYYEGGTLRNLKYAVKSGGVWTTEVVDAPGNVGRRTNLALGPSGNPFIVYADQTNFTIKVASAVASTGSVSGTALASCPAAGTPLSGVTIDAFDVASEMLSATAVTDGTGAYTLGPLAPGDYNVVIVTPLGYVATPHEQVVTVSGSTTLDFALSCAPAPPPSDGVRPTGFWKHQAGVAVTGRGGAQVDASTLCGYLDLIALHFNSNAVNPVVVYIPPASGECDDKLLVASNLLNLKGSAAMRDLARQQLLSLLLNVASGRLGTMTAISADGATTSQAITYCDNLIDSPTGDYATARTIAETINGGTLVPSGSIPLTTAQIAYREGIALRTFRVTPNPGPGERTFRFTMAEPGVVRLRVFDVSGRLVANLADGRVAAGSHTIAWRGLGSNGATLGSGVYLARLETPAGSRTLKVIQAHP